MQDKNTLSLSLLIQNIIISYLHNADQLKHIN